MLRTPDNMKKVTILDIAKELNITFSSVARALNDHPGISIATKQAVRETAERLGYKQNKLASSLRSGRTNIIGIIVPSISVSFFSSVVAGIEEIMTASGYNVLLYQSAENVNREKRGIETFIQSRVDGIITSISTDTVDGAPFRDLQERKVPLVFFDRTLDEIKAPSVTIDDYMGGFIATEHLIKQGYSRIIHLTTNKNTRIFTERLRGYIDALKHHGISVNEEFIIKGNFSQDFGRNIVTELYERGTPYDAIFALEDYTAMGALQRLEDLKIKVPDEVGVIGFANEAFGNLVSPGLSTIDQHTLEMGKHAANILLRIIKNPHDSIKPEKIILPPLLIERQSSLRSNAKSPILPQ